MAERDTVSRFAWGAILACVLGACNAKKPGDHVNLPSDIMWSSAHFDYHTRASETESCPSVLDLLEEHLGLLERIP